MEKKMTITMSTEDKLALAITSLRTIADMPTESEYVDADDCFSDEEALDAMNDAINQARHALDLMGV